MKHDWYVWDGEIDEKVIDGIVKRCEKLPTNDAVVNKGGKDFDSDGEHTKEERRSIVRWANRDRELRDIIWEYGTKANDKAFGFDIIDKFEIQYTTYDGDDKGFYTWHADNNYFSSGHYDRKISVVIQLSDPSEYEGGKFEFDFNGDIVSPKGFDKKGSIIAFPSFHKHRVTEVTKGKRNSLVSWIEGPHFK